jgi:hypothetical protein
MNASVCSGRPAVRHEGAPLAAGTGIRNTARLVGTGNASVVPIAAEMRVS